MSIADKIDINKFTEDLKSELLKSNDLGSDENDMLKSIINEMKVSFVSEKDSNKTSDNHTGGKRKSKLRKGRKNKKSSLRLKSYSFTN
jgi:hypothetical protein